MSRDEVLLPIQNQLEQQPIIQNRSTQISSFLQKLKGVSNTPVVDNEVNKYWNSNEAAEDIDPLEWWKTHTTEYSNLSKLALNYLCIQASSVPCEQLFSIVGQILCKSQNRLTGKSVYACICLHSWILENIN